MNILEVLQTIGICLGSFLLLLIFLMLLRLGDVFLPPTPAEMDRIEEEIDKDDALAFLKGKSREEIREMLHTPIPQRPKRPPSKMRKKTDADKEQGE